MDDADPPDSEASESDTAEFDSADAAPPESSLSESDLPEPWTVWNDEPDGRCILAYRPDVFDANEFAAACMPTLYLTRGSPNRPPEERRAGSAWYVTFYLEPDVTLPGTRKFDTREEALDAAVALAREFADGDVDYRDAYQVPRETYLDRLDELTDREN